MKKELRNIPLVKVFSTAGIEFCSVCHKGYSDKGEVEFIKEIGRCSACDHVEGEVMEDKEPYTPPDLPF